MPWSIRRSPCWRATAPVPDERAHRPPRHRGRAESAALAVAGERIALDAGDSVVLATPPWISAGLLPGLRVPEEHCAIVNAHFRLAAPPRLAERHPAARPGRRHGAMADRARRRGQRHGQRRRRADRPATPTRRCGSLARDGARRCACRGRCRRRASSRRSAPRSGRRRRPSGCGRRPAPRCGNLFLAGDWTATGLPATIEGAVRSGHAAAGLARASSR